MSAMGFEPMRTCVQWILSPLNHSGKLTAAGKEPLLVTLALLVTLGDR